MKKFLLLLIAISTSLASLAQNNSIYFDGIDDGVSLGQNFAFQTSDRFTAEAWIKVSEIGFQQVVSKLDVDFTGWGLQITSTGVLSGYLFSDHGVNSRFARGTQVMTDDNWHHVAMVWDGDDIIDLYIDGELEVLSEYSIMGAVLGPIDNTADTHIGNYEGNGQTGEYLKGNIDELRIWNVNRTAAEIADNYDTELSGTESGLIGYYKMDIPNSSCDVEDCSPSEIHGDRWALAGGEIPNFASEVPDITDVDCGNSNSCTLGADTNEILNDLALYPNPAKDEINLVGLPSQDEIKVNIYNTNGLLVKSLKITNKSFSVSELASGMYFINIEFEDRSITKKLVKE